MNLIRQDKILYPLILSLFCLIGFAIYLEAYPYGLSFAIMAICETIFMVSLFVIFPQKWGGIISCIGVVIFLISIFCNLVYSRILLGGTNSISRTIPIEYLLLLDSAADNMIVSNVLDCLKITDIVFPIAIIILILLWIIRRKSISLIRYSLKQKCFIVIAVILCFTFEQAKLIHNVSCNLSNKSFSNVFNNYKNNYYFSNVFYHGYIWHYNFSIIGLLIPPSDLNEKELSLLDSKLNTEYPPLDESLKYSFEQNSDKNVIMIIVESLNSKVLDFEPENIRVMPTIDSLIKAENSISFTKVYSQIGNGISSDGHLMYLSGLLPSRLGVMITESLGSPLPSLARTLNKEHSFECIGENPKIWFHNYTNKMYGFDELYSKLVPELDTTWVDIDSKLLKRSQKIISSQKSSFFSFITTISSHSPYKSNRIPYKSNIAQLKNFEERDKIYMETLNYTDKQIKIFLDSLKSNGLYDNSVIVIASDHYPPTNSISEKLNTKLIPVIILNASDKCIKIDRIIGQVDIYPTLLDILGVAHLLALGIGDIDLILPFRRRGPGSGRSALTASLRAFPGRGLPGLG